MAEWNIYTRSSPNRDNEDFEEAEVWSVMNETDDSSPKKWNSNKEYYNKNNTSNGSSSAWQLPSSSRKIKKASSSPKTSNEAKVFQQSSAPMNIPEWSKIYGKNATNESWGKNSYNADHNSDEDEYNDFRVPPHEYLAKKLARSQISSSSVCEGIGRTLKGRDLSKVRNAILTKTGFLE